MIIKYKITNRDDQEYLDNLKNFVNEFDDIKLQKFGVRVGALDLLTCIEIFGLFFLMKALNPFFSGVVNEDYFKSLGLKFNNILTSSKEEKEKIFKQLYEKITSKQKIKQQAIVAEEFLGEFNIKIVLNHAIMNFELFSNITGILDILSSLIDEGVFSICEIKVLQIYPSEDLKTWDYVLCPTISAFGRYVDRVYKISKRDFIYFNSSHEFKDYFNLKNSEKYKFLISFNREY